MLSTPEQVRDLVRRRGLVPLTGERSLVDAIAGERVKGGWWSHPRGKIIFRLTSALDDDESVLCVKLVEARVTFVDRAIWPALVRVATDRERRARAVDALDRAARALLEKVERVGELRLDAVAAARGRSKKELSVARAALERALLVVGDQEHSESGAHFARLRTWKRAVPPDARRRASALDYEAALATLEAACDDPRSLRAIRK